MVRDADLRLVRRQNIAREYLKGRYQVDIAFDLSVSIATVKRDLAKIRQDWLNSALQNFDALKAEQLARIDTIEAEAWEMWSRSCELLVRTSEQNIEATKFPGRNTKTDRIPGAGDPRYLQTALQCIERRCKLLGLNAPEKMAQTDSQGNDIDEPIPQRLREMDQDEIEARIRELQRKEVDGMTEDDIRELVEDITRGRFTLAPLEKE